VNNTTVLDNADRTDAGNCCIRKDCTAVFRGDASHAGSGSYGTHYTSFAAFNAAY